MYASRVHLSAQRVMMSKTSINILKQNILISSNISNKSCFTTAQAKLCNINLKSHFSTMTNSKSDGSSQGHKSNNHLPTDHDRTSTSSLSTVATPRLRISDILNSKKESNTGKLQTISMHATVDEAINHLVENKISSSLCVDKEGKLAGLFTARDILRFMYKSVTRQTGHTVHGNNAHTNKQDSLTHQVHEFMVPNEKLLFCSLTDTVRQARSMMSQSKIRHMPVIENGEILGLITSNDLADSAFSVLDLGGKKGFIQNVTGRRGVPEGTKIHLSNAASDVQSEVVRVLEIDVGTFALPHPFKSANGVAGNRRMHGAMDLCDDLTYCEDAHFAIFVEGAAAKSTTASATPADSASVTHSDAPSSARQQLYMCLADGVGSWRQFGIDPRQFSHNMVANAKKTIEFDAEHRKSLSQYPVAEIERALGGLGALESSTPIRPHDVMVDAWNMTVMDKITGSCTFCVATLDAETHQFSYANVGDCGLIIIRHIDSETAGYMRERQLPRHLRKNDLRIAYLCQQQLRSFNLPYQLGYVASTTSKSSTEESRAASELIVNKSETKGRFETPVDADTASIPVMSGDVVILATDGLFDNVDLDDIVTHVGEWEKKWFSAGTGDDIRSPSARGNDAINDLARGLAYKARECSLDPNTDSPFAVLAKENDIMWGGGMPDDTSVICARIY